MSYEVPPTQSSLPAKRPLITQFQQFSYFAMARVQRTDDFEATGKIDVLFLNRTQPAPVWAVSDGAQAVPQVGDFIIVGFLNGQKNDPFMVGYVAHKAWTSNFIRVEKNMIRLQFPTAAEDVVGQEGDTTSGRLRDDEAYLHTRSYIQLDAAGITVHVPSGTAINIVDGGNSASVAKAVARVGDTVTIPGVGSGTITSGSGILKSL